MNELKLTPSQENGFQALMEGESNILLQRSQVLAENLFVNHPKL